MKLQLLLNQQFFILLCSVLLSSCKVDEYNPVFPADKQIAHRGYWTAGAMENSLLAVKYAIDAGLYGAEIDIHQTKDKICVLNHDVRYKHQYIPKMTYQEILDKTNDQWGALPLLEDVLSIIEDAPNFTLIIEIKTAHDVVSIIDLVSKYQVEDQIVFFSADVAYCMQIIQNNPHLRVAYLNDDISPSQLYECGFYGLAYGYWVYLANPEWISTAKDLGMKVFAWTVDDGVTMRQLFSLNVDYIITNIPRIAANFKL